MRPANIANAVKLRTGKQEALEAADPGRFEPAPLLYFLDPFGHQGNFKIGAAADDGAHYRLLRAAEMDIADDFAIDFDFIRLEAGQQRKTGIAGTEIINRQANPLTAKPLDGAVKLVEPRDHLVFSNFNDHLLRLKAMLFNLIDQKFHRARDIHKRHGQQVYRDFMASNAQLFRQREGIRFRLEIDFIDFRRVQGAEEMFRAAAVIATDKRLKGADFTFRGLDNWLQRKLAGLPGNQAQMFAKG